MPPDGFRCINCGEGVQQGENWQGWPSWWHITPWDFSDPRLCVPRIASPDFDTKVRYRLYAGGLGGFWEPVQP